MIVVFLGPSLSHREARALLDAECRIALVTLAEAPFVVKAELL
ncbi:MAG: hypothetical protein ACOZQL_02665 [Myxococcota bacterium]